MSHMDNIHFVIRLTALICFFLAGINRPAFTFSIGWLGVFLWALSLIF